MTSLPNSDAFSTLSINVLEGKWASAARRKIND
jgi:hypothetical protein